MAAKEGDNVPLDMVRRGTRQSNPLGSAVFIGLRSLDPFLQYAILANGLGSGLLHKVGLQTLPPGIAARTGIAAIDALGLSPYRLILLSMAIGTSVKHIYWLLYTSKEEFPPGSAFVVSVLNTVFNSLDTLLFTCALTSTSNSPAEEFPQTRLLVGATMFTVGILVEAVSETQRKLFKDEPANKGKVYTGGLFSLARHINYTGYTSWRVGFAIAASGWIWGGLSTIFFLHDWISRGIPALDNYCQKRYGDSWTEYKRRVPYKLLPGVY